MYIFIYAVCSYNGEYTEDFMDLKRILSSWRFQENSPKDTLDSEIIINDKEIGCIFEYPRKKPGYTRIMCG